MALTFGTGVVLAAALLADPLPLHTTAEGVLWLPEDSIVRSTADGFVKALAVPSGTYVTPGTLLIEIEEPEVVSEIRVFRSRVDAVNVRLESERFSDRVQADLTRQALGVLEAALARAEKKAAELLVRSSIAGVFVVPRADDLPGRFVRRGEVIGYIGQPESRVVRVVVTQSDIDLVRTRLKGIEVKLPERPSESSASANSARGAGRSEELPSRALTGAGGGFSSPIPAIPTRLGRLNGRSNSTSSCRRVRHPGTSAAGSMYASGMKPNR